MQLYVDFIRLDRFLSTLEEELREISRIEDIWEKNRILSRGVPIEDVRMMERGRYLNAERERIQSRKNYLIKVQQLLSGVVEKNELHLEDALRRLQRLD